MKITHEQNEKHQCSLCSSEFTRKENMLRHIKDVHKGIKNHKCDVCSQAFSNSTVRKKKYSMVSKPINIRWN